MTRATGLILAMLLMSVSTFVAGYFMGRRDELIKQIKARGGFYVHLKGGQ